MEVLLGSSHRRSSEVALVLLGVLRRPGNHVDWVFSGQAVRAGECPEWCPGWRGSWLSVSLGGTQARGRPGEIEAGSSWAGVRGTAWGNLAAQGDPADLVQVVLVVLTVPLSWELVHCLAPHCSSGTGHKVGTLEPGLEEEVFLTNWK